MSRLSLFAVCLFAVASLLVEPAQAQFSNLVRPVPDSANALMLFNAEKVMESPAAISGGWKAERDKAFAAGLVSIPPETNQFVAASQLDFEFMEPLWDVAVLALDHAPSMASIAKQLGGSLDTVAELPAVVLPSDVYVVQLESQTVAAMSPANRQVVGRWLRETQTGQSTSLSPYLQEALGFADQVGTPIIMALDLRDVLVPEKVRQRAKELESLKNQTVDIEALTAAMCSMRGVTLGITFKERPFGSVKVDFGQDVSMIAEFAKPMLLEVLANQGAMIEDLEEWTPKVAGNTFTLSGHFSESGLRRVMSLMESPLSFAHAAKKGAEGEPGQVDQATMGQASKSYFDGVNSLFEDLHRRKGTANNLNLYGVWFDKYAGKVDQLPMLNVDPGMLDYGQYTANQLRNASAAIKGIGMRSRVRQVNEVSNMEAPTHSYGGAYGGRRYGRYGAYGGGGAYGGYVQGYAGNPLQGSLRQQQTIRTQVRAQEKGRGAANVQTIMQDLKETTAKVRRDMTQKYQIEF